MAVINSRARIEEAAKYFILAVVAFLFLFPIYAIVLASFRPGRDLMRFGVTFATLIPRDLNPSNFVGLVTSREGIYLVCIATAFF